MNGKIDGNTILLYFLLIRFNCASHLKHLRLLRKTRVENIDSLLGPIYLYPKGKIDQEVIAMIQVLPADHTLNIKVQVNPHYATQLNPQLSNLLDKIRALFDPEAQALEPERWGLGPYIQNVNISSMYI